MRWPTRDDLIGLCAVLAVAILLVVAADLVADLTMMLVR
jgi:hypothetical protein